MNLLSKYFFIFLSVFSSSLIMSSLMEENSLHGIVLAGGGSTRFNTGNSKLTYEICGQAMVLFPVMLLEKLGIDTTIVVGFQRDKIVEIIGKKTYKPRFIVQEQQLGTGHALLCTRRNWDADHILLLNGDMPLISEQIITDLIEQHIAAQAGISFVVSHNTDSSIGYGRLVDRDNTLRIVEAKHFTYKPKEYPLVNAGIYIINRSFLEKHLSEIEQNEVTNEFYVTDLVELAHKNNIPVVPVEVSFDVLHGVNTLKQLEKVERLKKRELTEYWMARGVRFENPKSVHIDLTVTIEPGSVIGAGVELHGNTHIGKKCVIGSFSILKDARIKDSVHVGSHSTIEKQTVDSNVRNYTHA